jgi:hypothetical protein
MVALLDKCQFWRLDRRRAPIDADKRSAPITVGPGVTPKGICDKAKNAALMLRGWFEGQLPRRATAGLFPFGEPLAPCRQSLSAGVAANGRTYYCSAAALGVHPKRGEVHSTDSASLLAPRLSRGFFLACTPAGDRRRNTNQRANWFSPPPAETAVKATAAQASSAHCSIHKSQRRVSACGGHSGPCPTSVERRRGCGRRGAGRGRRTCGRSA